MFTRWRFIPSTTIFARFTRRCDGRQHRAADLNINVRFALADAEVLPFPDECFDTVVSSLSTCTFPHPANAVREMARVSKPSGRILLLEHGRSDRRWLGRWQDRHADRFVKPSGCQWNHEPLELAKTAGLRILTTLRGGISWGYFTALQPYPQQRNG